MSYWSDLRSIPASSFGRRFLYTALLAAGITMTGFGSIFIQRTGPIPFKFIPDLRVFVLVGSGLMLGLYASGGGARRRAMALSGVFAYVVGFHLEEATVHWIGPLPGSITGSRVGILGTSGSLLAIAAVLLLHVEVESQRLMLDARARGASVEGARGLAAGLAGEGARQVLAVTAGVAGLAALVMAASPLFGENASGGPWTLVVGGVLLLGLALVLKLFVRRGVPARS